MDNSNLPSIDNCTMVYSYHDDNDPLSLEKGSAVYDSWINFLSAASGYDASISLLRECKEDAESRRKQQRVLPATRLRVRALEIR
jgi:hypothetical protein